jgi:hypothetical protein
VSRGRPSPALRQQAPEAANVGGRSPLNPKLLCQPILDHDDQVLALDLADPRTQPTNASPRAARGMRRVSFTFDVLQVSLERRHVIIMHLESIGHSSSTLTCSAVM